MVEKGKNAVKIDEIAADVQVVEKVKNAVKWSPESNPTVKIDKNELT